MTENRIRKLRKSHNLSQEALGVIINTTQQTVSKMENSTYAISTDLLINIAQYFNVSTDYILGISDLKRDLNGQLRMNREIEGHPTTSYSVIVIYQKLIRKLYSVFWNA